MISQLRAVPSWALVSAWQTPTATPSWDSTEGWAASLTDVTAAARGELVQLRSRWDHELADLGGDPTAVDWTAFRPLRRDREEDWSDWLAQLIADSRTGRFAFELFGVHEGRARSSYACREVHRELVIENRRADLVMEWTDGVHCPTHVEVKVGDPHLEKMRDTMETLERSLGRSCAHVLLILDEQRSAWDALRERLDPSWGRVHVLTWATVSRALHERGEDMRRRVWAHALCGAIEQELLDLRHGTQDEWPRRLPLSALRVALAALREGRTYGGEDD